MLTAIAEKLERGSAPVDTEQLIDELGLTRQDLTALRALDVEYLIMRWPERDHVPAQRPFDSWDLLRSVLLRCQVSLLAGTWESAAGVYL